MTIGSVLSRVKRGNHFMCVSMFDKRSGWIVFMDIGLLMNLTVNSMMLNSWMVVGWMLVLGRSVSINFSCVSNMRMIHLMRLSMMNWLWCIEVV